MCGIVGYAGSKESDKILLSGLKSLEYRGYDSAGIALIDNADKSIRVVKSTGKVLSLADEVEGYVGVHNLKSNIGIAHTRWATHGKPSHGNSHPHIDCSGNISVVHNGIIENYATLKSSLRMKGHHFASETDTEVIAHLIEDELACQNANSPEDLLEIIHKISSKLIGSFAVAVLYNKFPDHIFAVRVKSPLIIGLGENENFLASDISAFIDSTKKCIYLDDYDFAIISKEKVQIFDKKLNKKDFKIIELDFDLGGNSKNGYPHYMLKEIFEQPSAIRATISHVMEDINLAFPLPKSEIMKIKNILLIGCGTAYHACMVAKYWLEEYCQIPAQVEYASEFKYRKASIIENSLAILVSQSGETADTVAAQEKARSMGMKTLAICNVYESTLTRISDYVYYTKCGSEVSVASTKAFTAQLASLFSLTLYIAKTFYCISKDEQKSLLDKLSSLPIAIEELLTNVEHIFKIAEKYKDDNSFVFLGRNLNYPIALEGALKLKEITYLQAEAFPAGEIKHGPIAILNENMPVLAIMPHDAVFDKMMNACLEVMARGARTIAITDKNGAAMLKKVSTDIITLPNIPTNLFPFLSVIALQLFAYKIAELNGREIDQPRNLAKSVTVE